MRLCNLLRHLGFWVTLAWGNVTLAQTESLPRVLVVQQMAGEDHPNGLVPGFEKLNAVFGSQLAPDLTAPAQGPLRFLSLGGRLLPPASRVGSVGVRLLPVAPGTAVLRLKDQPRTISVIEITPRSAAADQRKLSRLALSRAIPSELALIEKPLGSEEEAFEFFFVGPEQGLPSSVEVASFGASGQFLDALPSVTLRSAPCPASLPAQQPELSCARTVALRLVVDEIERNHPALVDRSLLGQVGGVVVARGFERELSRMRVGAPEALSPDRSGRYRVRVRTRVLRAHKGGKPALGENDSQARRIMHEQLQRADQVWGQCGISLGSAEQWDVQIVDPPNITLLTVGCGRGLPASGGQLDFRVGGRRVFARTLPGQTPEAWAGRLAQLIRATGHRVKLYRNAQIRSDALPSFDLVIETQSGAPANIAPGLGQALSDDPTLRVCQQQLDLSDGLAHFGDFDAASGTDEERVLLRGLMDDDPSSIDLVIVPLFSGIGRIGESFIHSPGGSLQNAIVLDRMGIRAGARSFTLAHELGHILLSLPGHPDDFGVDTPHALMDSDAADPSVFGPRRLSLAECGRALIQSGPRAPVPLIRAWPLDQADVQ